MDPSTERTPSRRAIPTLLAILLWAHLTAMAVGRDGEHWVIGTEADYPPFSYFADDQIQGFNRAIVEEIAKAMQLDVELRIGPWGEIREQLEAGEIDAIVGMYYSPERDRLVDFSPPFFIVTHSVFSRDGIPVPKDEADLRGKRVCVMRGDIMHDHMRENFPDTELLFCDTIREGLLRLEQGTADHVLVARIPALYWIQELRLRHVHESDLLIRPSRYCLAVREGDHALLAKLEEGLTTIELNGRLGAARDRWLAPLDSPASHSRLLLFWGLVVVGPLLLLTLLVGLWTMVLRKTVAKRTAELSESKEHFKTTLESIGDAVITTDPQGRVTGLNPVAETLTQWTVEEALGVPLPEVFHIVNAMSGEIVANPVEKVIATGYIVGLANHTKLIGKHGAEYQISDSASPIRNEKGAIVGVVLIFRDVTEEYRWQQVIAENEAKLRSIYENMSEGLCHHEMVYDASGTPCDYRIIGVNPSFETILSVSRDQVVGKLATEAYGVAEPPYLDVYREVVETGRPTAFETEFAPMGRQFHISVFRPEPGQFVTVFSDITERKESERRIGEINSILRTIRTVNRLIAREKSRETLVREAASIMVENRGFHHCWIFLTAQPSSDPVFVLNPENPELEPALKEAIEARSLRCVRSHDENTGINLIPRPEIECTGCPLAGRYENQQGICSALAYGGRHYGFISAASKNDIGTTESEEAQLFRELADDLSFALFNLEVIEQEEQSRRQLIQAKEDAEEANRAKDDFLAIMSHELRTPLNPIVGYTSMIREESDSEEIRGYLDIILQSTERELELIDDILSYTRLNRKSFSPKWSEFSLFEACELALEDVREISHGLQLSFTPDPALGPDLYVRGERNMLLKILDNLLGNACKYTREGSVGLRLSRLHSNASKTEFCFEVWDTGIGLEESQIERIFQPFTQVDSSYTREFEGVGLGLSICRKLVEFLDGDIEVSSTPGKGSSFRVRLPLEVLANASETSVPQAVHPPSHPVTKWNKSVLLAEDNELNISVTCEILRKFEIECDIAHDGLEALSRSQERKFDLIFMDLAMPVMDGLRATRAIREQAGPNQHTPIIALTADATDEAREKCLRAGMGDFLVKPVQVDQLAEAFEKLWGPDEASTPA